jgi:predicted SnoaL-like aldol condensation-catalyzing enzyme
MNNHDFDYILEKYWTSPYLQHNRAIPNEIEGVVSYVKTMVHRFPEYSFDVKKIFADWEYVILHSHATFFSKHRGNEKKWFIITDTFKFNNWKLSEHWDSVQPIDLFSRFLILITWGDQKNENSIF